MFHLSKGSLRQILDGNPWSKPLLQILQIKNIQNNVDGMTRYKVTLFDGDTQHTFGILATQKNHLVEDKSLKIGSVIELEEFAANVLSKDPPKVVIILLNFKIVGEMEIDLDGTRSATETGKKAVQNENAEPKIDKTSNAKSFFNKESSTYPEKQIVKSKPQQQSASADDCTPGMFNGFKIFGIANLNPYQNKWSIKARVTNKSPIRKWSNAKGEGKVFSVDLLDATGEIKASGFTDTCDKFYDMIQVDNVYFISRAQLKTANKQFSKLSNDYEMTFNSDTLIEPCHETDNLPKITYDILPISELTNKQPNDFVDIIAVVKATGDISMIITKATQKELKKRELVLVDNSNCSVNCTLWGQQAEEFDGSEKPVILLRGAKLSDFNGRSLSVAGSTIMQINPDIPEAHKMRGWFDQGIDDSNMQDLSKQGGGASGGGMTTPWKTLDCLNDPNMGMGEKGDWFQSKAVIMYAKKDNSMYMACPEDSCNKKVIDQNDGSYRCEKCSKNHQSFKWRMILNLNISDYSESNWATCFQDTAETILGIKADDLGELKTAGDAKYDDFFAKCVFKEFNFKIRAKMETYNDERRVKLSVAGIEEIDFVKSSQRLLQQIKHYAQNCI